MKRFPGAVVQPLVLENQRLLAHLEHVSIFEGDRRYGTPGILAMGQQGRGVLVGHDGHRGREERRRADVIRVLVAVHDVSDGLTRDARHSLEVTRPKGRERIDGDDALRGDEEHRVVGSVRQPVQAVADLLDDVGGTGGGDQQRNRGAVASAFPGESTKPAVHPPNGFFASAVSMPSMVMFRSWE